MEVYASVDYITKKKIGPRTQFQTLSFQILSVNARSPTQHTWARVWSKDEDMGTRIGGERERKLVKGVGVVDRIRDPPPSNIVHYPPFLL